MGCTSSTERNATSAQEPNRDPPPYTPNKPMTTNRTEDLTNLMKDRKFQADVTERSFQFVVHETLEEHWDVQLDILVAAQFIFDRVTPSSATVIFPNRPLKYLTSETEVFAKLTHIQHVSEGFQIWVHYLAQQEQVHLEGGGWDLAFKWRGEGYQISLSEAEAPVGTETTATATNGVPRRNRFLLNASKGRSLDDDGRSASEMMTKTIEDAYTDSKSAKKASNEALKDTIRQKARDLLQRHLEPVPLDLAVKNFKELMKESSEARTGIGMANVALQAIVDAKEAFTSMLGSKVKVIFVKGTIPEAHGDMLLNAHYDIQTFIKQHQKGSEGRRMDTYGISFVGLPGTGNGGIWHKLDDRGNGKMDFVDYEEIPADIHSRGVSGKLMRKLLLGSVDPTLDAVKSKRT